MFEYRLRLACRGCIGSTISDDQGHSSWDHVAGGDDDAGNASQAG